MTHHSERHIFTAADYRLRLWLWANWCADSFVRFNVVVVRHTGGAFTSYALFADEQGSVLTVADKDGNRVFEASYDAWGRQTVSTNTIGFTRGYTGHEMLAEFGIINMGGRLYDPVLGRFFSPDNYVQAPTDSQNFNRYSYCLNNPLKYTDPTGQLINPFAVLAILNIGKSIIDAATGKSSWKTALFNIASAALTYGIGQAFGTVGGIGHELLRAGAHGLSTGVFTVLGGGNFGSGFVSGATASGIGSFAEGIKNISPGLKLLTSAVAGGMSSWASGGDFIMGAVNGLRITALNHLVHTKDNILTYKVEDGEISALMPEIICTQRDVSWTAQLQKKLEDASVALSIFDSIGKAIKRFGASIRIGSNLRIYVPNQNGIVFRGNQYVTTEPLKGFGAKFFKLVARTNIALNITEIAIGGYKDITLLHYCPLKNGRG